MTAWLLEAVPTILTISLCWPWNVTRHPGKDQLSALRSLASALIAESVGDYC